jgi:hypothetical protein
MSKQLANPVPGTTSGTHTCHTEEPSFEACIFVCLCLYVKIGGVAESWGPVKKDMSLHPSTSQKEKAVDKEDTLIVILTSVMCMSSLSWSRR